MKNITFFAISLATTLFIHNIQNAEAAEAVKVPNRHVDCSSAIGVSLDKTWANSFSFPEIPAETDTEVRAIFEGTYSAIRQAMDTCRTKHCSIAMQGLVSLFFLSQAETKGLTYQINLENLFHSPHFHQREIPKVPNEKFSHMQKILQRENSGSTLPGLGASDEIGFQELLQIPLSRRNSTAQQKLDALALKAFNALDLEKQQEAMDQYYTDMLKAHTQSTNGLGANKIFWTLTDQESVLFLACYAHHFSGRAHPLTAIVCRDLFEQQLTFHLEGVMHAIGSSIQVFDLKGLKLAEDATSCESCWFHALRFCTDLRCLYLHHAHIDSYALRALAEEIPLFRKLKTFSINHNPLAPFTPESTYVPEMREKTTAEVNDVDTSDPVNAREIESRTPSIDDDGEDLENCFKSLGAALGHCSNLAYFYAQNCGIGIQGANYLSEAFKPMKHLQCVDLSFNGIYGDAIIRLLTNLHGKDIRNLNLSELLLDERHFESLRAFLTSLPQARECTLMISPHGNFYITELDGKETISVEGLSVRPYSKATTLFEEQLFKGITPTGSVTLSSLTIVYDSPTNTVKSLAPLGHLSKVHLRQVKLMGVQKHLNEKGLIVQTFADHFYHPSLTDLCLDKICFEDQDITADIITALIKNGQRSAVRKPQLITLQLSSLEITDQTIKSWFVREHPSSASAALSSIPMIKGFNPQGFVFSRVERLILDDCPLGDNGALSLCYVLSSLPIHMLSLRNCGIQERSMVAILAGTSPFAANLETDQAQYLAQKIHTLDLYGNFDNKPAHLIKILIDQISKIYSLHQVNIGTAERSHLSTIERNRQLISESGFKVSPLKIFFTDERLVS